MAYDYNAAEIEAKWQHYWAEQELHCADEDISKPKFYALSIFPYPSGHLNLEHIRRYTITDAIARVHRMQGCRVLYPMGWDAFGLPAENAAFDQGLHPALWTQQNIDKMRNQLKRWGLSVDWDREITTCSPNYYRWTQQIFLAFLKAGLAYRKEIIVNWDPITQTRLTNDQLDVNGCSYQSGAKVERRIIGQWYFKITAYAEQLWQDLNHLSGWPEPVKQMQKNWIGKYAETAGSNYRLQDWLISRDRYWGTPIPIIHCVDCGLVPVPENQLPVTLPENVEFVAHNTSPLKTLENWINVDCPTCGKSATRDTNTMDTFVDSSWYYLRFADAHNEQQAFSLAKVNVWMAVDQYVVSANQAYLHLLYSRFFTKALHDLGLVNVDEPFTHLLNPGIVKVLTYKNPITHRYILASQVNPENPGADFLNLINELRQEEESSTSPNGTPFSVVNPQDNQYSSLTPADLDQGVVDLNNPRHPKSGEPFQILRDPETGTLLQVSFEKMSISRQNSIDLEAILSQYGADVVRMYILSQASPEADLEWKDADLENQVSFLNQVWQVVSEFRSQLSATPRSDAHSALTVVEENLQQIIHTTIRNVTTDIDVDENYRFDKAISKLLALNNALDDSNCKNSRVYEEGVETLIKLMAPLAPHVTEELWHLLGHASSLHRQPWPQCQN
ncbi:MAG: class I tRNA ligase family protein [Leptolyngbyaceae cyanobacterium]